MNIFILISGYVFWILLAAIAMLILAASLLDRWEAFKDKQNAAIQIEAARKVGDDIFSSAYWLHGEQYEDIPPYVLMRTLGEHIERTGWLSIERLRNEELPKAVEEYRKEHPKCKTDLHIVD